MPCGLYGKSLIPGQGRQVVEQRATSAQPSRPACPPKDGRLPPGGFSSIMHPLFIEHPAGRPLEQDWRRVSGSLCSIPSLASLVA
jgi:hypothetical protein